MKYYLAFDIGGTHIKFAVLDGHGNILESDQITTANRGEQIVHDIVDIKNHLMPKYVLQGVAFSMPGFVNIDTGYLQDGGAIDDFSGINFKQLMTERLGLPVELDNDGNCVAMAERWLGKGQHSDNFICMNIGTGVGGAICLNGEIMRGYRYMGAEFGYMLINNFFKSAGKTHCSLNFTASIREGLIGCYCSEKNIDSGKLSGKDIYLFAEQGDPLAIKIIDQFYECIALGLYNLTFILNPEKILIGGAISANSEIFPAIKAKFQAILNSHPDSSRLSVDDLVSIESAHFKNSAGMVGALYHFLRMQNGCATQEHVA